jgi:hypothetical protein
VARLFLNVSKRACASAFGKRKILMKKLLLASVLAIASVPGYARA